MTKHFSFREKLEICTLFENGATLKKIAKFFDCSGGPIKRILIEDLSKEKYEKILKDHLTIYFSKEEKEKIYAAFENQTSIDEIAKIFECSGTPIRKILITSLGLEKYKEMLDHFSIAEKEKICKLFKDDVILSEISKLFKCSRDPIGRVLISEMGIEEYKRVAKEHSRRNSQEIGRRTIKYAQEANWKDGISLIPFEKSHGMTPEEWQKLAQEIRKRDKFICQYCGKKRSTSVHHIIPRRIKIDNHPDNLITLCKKCHPTIEKLTDKYINETRDPIEIFYEKWSA